MGSFSIWHWLIVLVVVLVVFGTRKLRNVGSDLGGAVKGFKEAMHEDQAMPQLETTSGSTTADIRASEKAGQ